MPPNATPEKKWVGRSFSRAAEDYDRVATLQRQIGDRLISTLSSIPITPEKVLDIGAGTGYCTSRILELYPSAEIVALDLAEGMIMALQSRFSGRTDIVGVCGDAEGMPFADQSFDCVFSNLAFQWCHQLEKLFGEIKRILKPNGTLIFSTFCTGTLKELEFAWAQVDKNTHVNRFESSEGYKEALIREDFKQINLECFDCKVVYPEILVLMRELKALGARNFTENRPRGLTGRGTLQRLREAYDETPATNKMLRASFHYIIGQASL